MTTKQNNRRELVGTVVSDKMQKTIVVNVDTVKTHAKYGKQYVMSKRFKVHDEKNEFKVGDKVAFEECRPYSRDKRWRVIGKAA
ncbi:MAG: 30S ribosomal protein S17 [Patescibacteria group bacterium]|nr:MAG: 30S ribosomal protein S17 [Patescibacteria group bacterium]